MASKRKWSSSERAFYTTGANGKPSTWIETDAPAGWTDAWSTSESRPYFVHSLTGLCVWDKTNTSRLPFLTEDTPSLALERGRLHEECLTALVNANEKYGPMTGNTKTARACRDQGMRIGIQGLFSRVVWTQSLEQVRRLGEIGARRRDAVFPLHVSEDEDVITELKDAGRTREDALVVYSTLAKSLESASLKLIESAKQQRNDAPVISLIADDSNQSALECTDESLCHGKMLTITYDTQSFSIRGDHLRKLLMLYAMHTQPDAQVSDQLFLQRVFCVIARYETLSGTADGYQMAFPASGFQWLRDRMGVTCECFASPLNVWNQRFCSVSFDVDRYFGSLGNFFCFDGIRDGQDGGSYEANPPFVESVMEHMARKIQILLESSKDSAVPWSFAVIVPGWDDAKCVSYQIMSTSTYARPFTGYKLVLDKRAHNYRPGMQQREARDEQPSNVNTFVFFLQNDAGAKKWPITSSAAQELRALLKSECV